jgi:hypothetical protein
MCSYLTLHQNLAKTACALYDDTTTSNSVRNLAQVAKYLPEQKLCPENNALKNDTHTHVTNNMASKRTNKQSRFIFLYRNFRHIAVLQPASGHS